LKTSIHHPYRLFHLKKMVVITENQKQWHWEIKELDNSSQRSIPWETVIVLYDPKLIESIKDIFWDDKKNTIYSLPILCLKETDSHSLVRTNLTHMDFKFLHRETHHVSIMSPNNRIISMAYSQQGIKL